MKNALVIISLGFLFFAQNCLANGFRTSQFELASEVSHIAYKEPGVMKQDGIMYGIVGSYTYLEGLMLQLEGRLMYGQVDYTSPVSGDMGNVDDILGEFRVIAGYDMSPYQEYIIVPYFGFGYRYLEDDSQGQETDKGSLGYRREANYYYSPIGIKMATDIGDDFIFGACIEYDYFWEGVQKSYLSGAIPIYSDLENKQKKGYGYRASIKIAKQQEYLDFVIEPYIRYWKIEQSESADLIIAGVIRGFGYEPKNYSTEYGIKIALHF